MSRIGRREQNLKHGDGWSMRVAENRVNSACMMVDVHWHEYYELLYIKRGEALEIVNGAEERMQEGDIVLIMPGAQHSTIALSEDGCAILVLVFYLPGMNFDSLLALESDYVLPFLNSGPGVYSHIGRDDAGIMYIAHQIEQEFRLQRPGHQVMLRGLLYQLLGHLIREGKFAERRELPGGHLEVVRSVCRYIEDNYGGDLRLKTVADRFGYSPEYFSRLFSGVVGRSYRSYCEYVRLSVAERLLRQQLSLQEIAEQVGYESVSGFVRAYRRVKGSSPQDGMLM